MGAASSSRKASAAFTEEAASANAAAAAMGRYNGIANQNRRGSNAAAANVANLAAQFQDIGVTAAMAMNPLQIALQQGTQISAVLGPMGAAGAVRSLGTAFLSVISPVSLVTIGLVALAAVGIQAVDWAKTGASALNAIADILPMVAHEAAIAAAGLALAFSPAIIRSVVLLTAAIANGLVGALKSVALWAAANPLGAFVIGVTAAIIAAYHFRDEVKEIFGVDLIGVVKDYANVVLGVMVGAYAAVVAAWENLPEALGALGYEAADKFVRAIQYMAREAIAITNGLIRSINGAIKDSGIQLPTLGAPAAILPPSQDGIANPYGAGGGDAAKKAIDAYNAAQGQDYVGKIGETVTGWAGSAADALRRMAKGLLEVDEKGKKGKSTAEKLAEAYERIVTGAKRHIAESQAEAAALGMTEQQALKLRYQTELLNQAQDAGITLTAAQRAELMALGEQMATAEVATNRITEAFEFAKDVTRGFVSDLRQGLEAGKGFWESFKGAVLNVLDKIISKIEDELVNALFSLGGGGGGGGIGGFIASLFGGGGGADPWGGLRLASGGFVSGPGSGTSDSIPARLSHGEFVMNAASTRAFRPMLEAMNSRRMATGGYVDRASPAIPRMQSAANGNGGGRIEIGVSVVSRMEKNGNLQTFVENIAEGKANKAAGSAVTQFSRDVLPERVQQISGDRRKRG